MSVIKRCDTCNEKGCSDFECDEHELTVRYYGEEIGWMCEVCKEKENKES